MINDIQSIACLSCYTGHEKRPVSTSLRYHMKEDVNFFVCLLGPS